MVPVVITKDEILKVADISRLFTLETFCKVVVRALWAVQCEDSRGRGSVETGAPKTDG
jgi:hypothetical protein